MTRSRHPSHVWPEASIPPGHSADIELTIGESYSGNNVRIPIHVRRGEREGPTLFLTAALHGDELNGTGAIRDLILSDNLQLVAGTLLLIPVLNVLGFDRHSRYLPDRRDLNRCFPGSHSGSLARRMARIMFDEIVGRSDFGIDLHTAAVRRTNFPNVRANLLDEKTRRLAQAFGSEIIIDSKGPQGSFRREATSVGCPTITFEGGEVWKVEPTIVEYIMRGAMNVMMSLGMIEGNPTAVQQRVIQKTKWIRAERGGFLHYHVRPGDVVAKDQPLATNASLLGRDQVVILSPFDAVVIGLSTIPAVSPGEPICHLGMLASKKNLAKIIKRGSLVTDQLHLRVQDELATNVKVVEPADP